MCRIRLYGRKWLLDRNYFENSFTTWSCFVTNSKQLSSDLNSNASVWFNANIVSVITISICIIIDIIMTNIPEYPKPNLSSHSNVAGFFLLFLSVNIFTQIFPCVTLIRRKKSIVLNSLAVWSLPELFVIYTNKSLETVGRFACVCVNVL